MEYADTSKPAPVTFACDLQPYGRFVIGNCRWGEYNGFPTLNGTVLEGTETARLFTATSTKSIAGQPRTIYGVKAHEIERGECIRIAM